MDSTLLLSVVGVAVLLSIIFVFSLCIDCWRSKQPISIHQRTSDSSPEYPVSGFVVRHPQSTYVPHSDLPPHLSQRITTSYQLPISPSMTTAKVPSCPPSETGSQASYVNQDEDKQYVQPPDERDNYIIVIPDIPNLTSPSRASSHSSAENYINVEEAVTKSSNDSDQDDSPDYENLNDSRNLGNQTPAQSCGSLDSDDLGSSDYVNTDPHLS